jgi:hypothetical protein
MKYYNKYISLKYENQQTINLGSVSLTSEK